MSLYSRVGVKPLPRGSLFARIICELIRKDYTSCAAVICGRSRIYIFCIPSRFSYIKNITYIVDFYTTDPILQFYDIHEPRHSSTQVNLVFRLIHRKISQNNCSNTRFILIRILFNCLIVIKTKQQLHKSPISLSVLM